MSIDHGALSGDRVRDIRRLALPGGTGRELANMSPE